MSVRKLRLVDAETWQIMKALSSQTNLKILQLLSQEKSDVSKIATRSRLSEPSIGEGIENLQLVRTSYAAGKRGIRKACELTIEKLILTFKEHA